MQQLGAWISNIAALASFSVALMLFMERLGSGTQDYSWSGFEWIRIGKASLNNGYELNQLNTLMLLSVTAVGLAIHIYSAGYMKNDERKSVYFSYLSLFLFAMLALVLSENLFQLFIFWELVGLGSFLLIGFWYTRPEAKAAAYKAFIVTRIGDVALLIAIW